MNKLICTAALTVALSLAGCGQSEPEFTGPRVTGPMIIEMNPSGRAALAGIARFTTDQPTRATITISDDAGHSFGASSGEEFAAEHEIMLLGFRPDRTHNVVLTLESEDGSETQAATVSIKSPELPPSTPPIEVTASAPDAIEPGFTLIPTFRWINQQVDPDQGQILIVDPEGEIVWHYIAPHGILETKQLGNGHLLYLNFGWTMTEIDMLGNVVHEWYPARTQQDSSPGSIAVDADTFHHDVLVMPSGNFLALSTEVRQVPDWYTSETDPDAPRKTQDVIGDVLIEFQPDGTLVNEWKFFDLLDPYRIGYGSLSTDFYTGVYDEPKPDWTHMNGIDYDAATNTALISTNHLSTVMDLDLDTGQLLWMLGDPRGWGERWSNLLLEPEGDMIWSYHHHAPEWTSEGTMLLFDNGASRARPFDPPLTAEQSFSRAVEYEIDAANHKVKEVWSYGGPGDEIFLSAYISDVDLLPRTGNVLVTEGGRVRDNDGNVLMFPEQGHNWVTVSEVTHTKPAEKLWELAIDDRRWGVAAFRSERIDSLYW